MRIVSALSEKRFNERRQERGREKREDDRREEGDPMKEDKKGRSQGN